MIIQHPDEARGAQQRVAKVQEFFTKLGWKLGREQTAPSLTGNALYVVEYAQLLVSSPPRLRDARGTQEFLDVMRTTRLSDGQSRHLVVFTSPAPVIEAAIAAAAAALAKAEDARRLTDGCQLVKDIEELQFRAGQLLDAGKHDELAKVAANLDASTKRLAAVRAQREKAVVEARAKLDAAKADRELLARAEHRYLRVERAPWLTGNSTSPELIAAHERSEVVRAVDSITSIDLTEWTVIDVARPPLPFPIGWLEMLVPVPLPDVKGWVSARYEEIDADAPASAGVATADLHRAFLEAHGLHATHCPIETFSATVGEVFKRKRANTGSRFLIQLKLTETQKEARLRALFEAEKAAKEREEFETWKRSRAEAAAAVETEAAE